MTHDETKHVCLCTFSPDEREVLMFIAARIDKARPQYGPMVIDSDQRDWDAEAHFEDVDAVVYRSVAHIKKQRAKKC